MFIRLFLLCISCDYILREMENPKVCIMVPSKIKFKTCLIEQVDRRIQNFRKYAPRGLFYNCRLGWYLNLSSLTWKDKYFKVLEKEETLASWCKLTLAWRKSPSTKTNFFSAQQWVLKKSKTNPLILWMFRSKKRPLNFSRVYSCNTLNYM